MSQEATSWVLQRQECLLESAEAPGVSRGVSVGMVLTVSFTALSGMGGSALMLGTMLAGKLVARKRLSTQCAKVCLHLFLCPVFASKGLDEQMDSRRLEP